MNEFWVVVADGSRARFFRGASARDELEEFRDMVNEEVRQNELDMVTDKPGRMPDQDREGRSVSRSSTELDEKERNKKDFAREVGKFIEQARASGRFEHISLIADPKFLGHMRKPFSGATQERVLEEISKNLTKADEETIRNSLDRLAKGFK